jgi:predicted ATPase
MGGTSAQDLVRNIEKAQIKTAALTSGMTLAEENISSLQKQLETAKTYDLYGTSKKAFGELAQTMPTTEKLANIYGEDTSNLSSELQQEAFFGLQSQRRKRLQQREQATFGGQAGISTAGLARGTAGSF